MKRTILLCLCALLACDNSSGPEKTPPPGKTGPYSVVNAFPNLTFSRPTDVQNAGDGTHRLFVAEQSGFIRVFSSQGNPATSSVFLDISSEVLASAQSELGLLGLTFHPQYETNGYFFVAYTAGTPASHTGRISRFQVSLDANVADPASEKILLEFQDDYPNHNGGGLCFGSDGYLYIGIGDEGGAGDPDDNAQDRSRVFGKILRIDVDQNVNTPPYHGIPADNPYAGNSSGYREDIYAYGLRNPWRISFDKVSGKVIAGDVGQGTWEEIDIIQKGGNYGWDCREGHVAYDQNDDQSSPLCATATGLVEPIFVYDHSVGQSITGGYVYRGPSMSGLAGRYVYGDYDSGRIWSLNLANNTSSLLVESGMFLSTFGVADNNELYVAAYFADGTATGLYRFQQDAAP